MGGLEYVGSTGKITDLEDNKEKSVVWPLMTVVANLPFEHNDDCYLDDGFLGDSAKNLKDDWIKQGYKPVKVYPLWSCLGHSGFAVVEFGKEWDSFNNIKMFVDDFEVEKHGRKDWYDCERCEDDKKLYAWIANDEDFYSNGIVGVFLRKNGVLNAVSTIEKVNEVKTPELLLGLETVLEEMKKISKEIQCQVNVTKSHMDIFIKQKDMLIENFNKDLKNLQEKANKIIIKLQHDDGEKKMRDNKKLSNQIIELQKKVDDKELEINQMKYAMDMVKNLTDENVEANKKIESIQEDLKEKENEIKDLKELNQALTAKKKSSNDELTAAMKELIDGLRECDSSSGPFFNFRMMNSVDLVVKDVVAYSPKSFVNINKELWHRNESRKATLIEGVRFINKKWKEEKQKNQGLKMTSKDDVLDIEMLILCGFDYL